MRQMFKAEKAAIDNMEDLSYNSLILHKDPHLQKSRRALALAVTISLRTAAPKKTVTIQVSRWRYRSVNMLAVQI